MPSALVGYIRIRPSELHRDMQLWWHPTHYTHRLDEPRRYTSDATYLYFRNNNMYFRNSLKYKEDIVSLKYFKIFQNLKILREGHISWSSINFRSIYHCFHRPGLSIYRAMRNTVARRSSSELQRSRRVCSATVCKTTEYAPSTNRVPRHLYSQSN